MESLRLIDCLFVPQNATTPELLSGDVPRLPTVPCLTHAEDLVSEMARHGIDHVLLTSCQVRASRCERQYLCDEALLSEFLQLIRVWPRRFSALAGYNPHEVSDSLRRMDEAVILQAVRGFYMSHGGLDLLDRRMYPAYARCVELSVPIVIYADSGYRGVEGWQVLEQIKRIATEFAELRVLAACVSWPQVSEVRRILEQRDNVHFALDANPGLEKTAEASVFLNSYLGFTRCLWGSNGGSWPTAIAQIDSLELSSEARERFTRGNASALFGLERQNPSQPEADLVLTGE